MPLTADEALALAEGLGTWPPGLGFVIQRDASHPRGWRRAPGYRPFGPPPPASSDTRWCPVVQLHEARRATYGERPGTYYRGHLAAFWDIAAAVAAALGLRDLQAARHRYNDLLRTDPPALAALLRAYAREGRP